LSGAYYKILSEICLDRMRETADNLNQDRWPKGQKSNLAHPEYEIEVLTNILTGSAFASSGQDGEG
jgi:hypothetical protein